MSSPDDPNQTLEQLFVLHSNDVFRYARLTLGNHTDAKDVVQEVFCRAFRSWENFRGESSAKTWLISIARNYIFDLLRKKRRERKLLDGYHPPTTTDGVSSLETMMVLEQSIQQLKPNYREVFVLRHIENLSIEETAQIIGCSEGKVRTTDYRAIQKLRELMVLDALEVNVQR